MKRTGNTILITGGSSGIGRALARRWHDAGNTVIVAARRAEELAKTVEGRSDMAWYELDVEDGASIAAVAERVIAEHPDLNVLVSCAGVAQAEDITTSRDLSPAVGMIATNLVGPIRLVDAFVDHLKGKADAALVVVSSGTGFVPYPVAATYAATKAALHSYVVSLSARLESGVQVIEIVPPQVATDLMEGLKDDPNSVPLEKFADDVMTRLVEQPSADEIIVEEVRPFRFAEREGKVEEIVAGMMADS